MVKKKNKQTDFNGHAHGEKHKIFKVQNNGFFSKQDYMVFF